MPILFCSIKLSKLIGVKTRQPSISLDNWNGHIFYLEGRKCLVFVHKETFYSFVIFDVLKKQLNDFKTVFVDNLLKQLEKDKLLTNEIRNLLIDDFENFELSTTDGDKSTIGYMNDCITRLTWPRDGEMPTIAQTKAYVNQYYNDNLLLTRQATTPIHLMRERLKNYR
jgi:hypothetical protein